MPVQYRTLKQPSIRGKTLTHSSALTGKFTAKNALTTRVTSKVSHHTFQCRVSSFPTFGRPMSSRAGQYQRHSRRWSKQCGLAAAKWAAASWRAKRLNERTLHKHRKEREMSVSGRAFRKNHRRIPKNCRDRSIAGSPMRLGPLPNSSLAKAGPGVTACRQRSQVFCAGDALSKFEYRFPEGDRAQRSKEKTSRDSFFVHVRLVYRRQGGVPKARQHVRTRQESVLLPRHRLVHGKNRGPRLLALCPWVERIAH